MADESRPSPSPGAPGPPGPPRPPGPSRPPGRPRLRGRLRLGLEHVGLFMLFAARTAVGFVWPPLRLRATLYQIYVQGVHAVRLAAVACAFTGLALSLQFGTGLARFGATSLLPQIVSLSLLRELIPVVAGLVVGGRLGAGIAAEMGSMAVSEQLDAVRVLGADPVRELVVPRVLAGALVLPLITVFGDVVAVVSAAIIGGLEHGIGFSYFLDASREFVLVEDFLSGVGRSMLFGWMVALLGCWHGGRAVGGADGVGRATTQTVVHGALAVIVSDYFVARAIAPLLAKGPSL